MDNKKYLSLYEAWMETGHLPYRGLCDCFGEDPLFQLFNNDAPGGYWGARQSIEYSPEMSSYDYTSKFTNLRQTVVLLMAAMNDEL